MTKTINRAAAVAATLVSGMALPASASPVQDAYGQHIKHCIGLFFSDTAAHSAQCLPNNMPNIPAHAGGSGGPVVVAPPPPPVVIPDPDVGTSYPQT